MKRNGTSSIVTAGVVLAALGTAVYAQDKYALKSPSGIAFSDFKGYEDWSDFIVRQALDGEVLAELPVREIAAAQPLLPVAVRLDLVDEDRSLLAAVAAEVALAVAFDVEPPDPATAVHGFLPDPRAHGPSTPFDVAGKAHVDGEQSWHRDPAFRVGTGWITPAARRDVDWTMVSACATSPRRGPSVALTAMPSPRHRR